MIVALYTILALLAVPSHEQDSHGTTLTSPCPRVFKYDPPISDPRFWSGVVALTTDIFLQSTSLNIELDSHATRLVNGLGNATTEDGLNFVIDNEEMQIHPGEPVLVPFFIEYDPLNTIPRLRAIRLNGKVICDDDTQQSLTVGRPVIPAPDITTNSNMKQVRIPPSKPNIPVVNNNSSPAFNAEQPYTNTLATPEMVECGVVSGGNEGITLSSRGLNYTRGDIPWLVAIYKLTDKSLYLKCGGTLVSHRHVVSAASCIVDRSGVRTAIKNILIKLGVYNLYDWADESFIDTGVVAVSIHEDYNPSTYENNIMILALARSINFGHSSSQYIRPACLWTGETALSHVVGATGVVSGWDVTSAEDKRDRIYGGHANPHMVLVPIVSTSYCRASKPAFQMFTFDKTFCAGSRNGVGPCIGAGDSSGAGLYLLDDGRWRLRGIVSVGLTDDSGKDCNLNEFVVYTDAAQYLTWMKHILSVQFE